MTQNIKSALAPAGWRATCLGVPARAPTGYIRPIQALLRGEMPKAFGMAALRSLLTFNAARDRKLLAFDHGSPRESWRMRRCASTKEFVMLSKMMVVLAIALAFGSPALSTSALARGGGGFHGGGFSGGGFHGGGIHGGRFHGGHGLGRYENAPMAPLPPLAPMTPRETN